MTTQASKRNTSALTQARRKQNRKPKTSRVVVPAAAGIIMRNVPRGPKVVTSGRSTFVTNTETLATISTSAAFASTGYSLNPLSFTWLNGLASNYSKWRWVELKLQYIPACPTTTSGQFTMSLGYDTLDTAPATMAGAQSMYRAVTAPYWAGADGAKGLHSPGNTPGAVDICLDTHNLGSGAGLTWYRYVSPATYVAASVSDRNIYCPAQFYFCHSGGPTTAIAAGTIAAHYVIEVIEPIPSVLNL